MRDPLLSDSNLTEALSPLLAAGWVLSEDRTRIKKAYRFKNFQQAFGWMTTCALWAETLDHHPTWTNTWNRVSVELTTHDSKGLTQLDIDLARKMDVSAEPILQG